MSEITLTSANFEAEVTNSKVPVLVDFWAEWCMPCRMIAPVIEELARENAGKLKVAKVNVDQENDLASQFGIVSIPTLLVFSEGKIARQKVGALPKREIEALFKDLLA
jgi:thioredoxin 1